MKYTSILLLLPLVLAVLGISCKSLDLYDPHPESALLTIVIENHSERRQSFLLQTGKIKDSYRLKSGETRIIALPISGERNVGFLWGEKGVHLFDVPENKTVQLHSEVIELTEAGPEFREIRPEDRKAASEFLLDSYGFYQWADWSFVNFYPYQPRRFDYDTFEILLDTDIPAEAWVDGIHWGGTPLSVSLPAGSHQLIYRDKEEKELFRTFIDVSGDSQLTHTLTQAENSASGGSYQLIMGSFVNYGDESEDYIQPLIEDGIVLNLSDSDHYQLTRTDSENPLNFARETGSELLLHGSYETRGTELLIFANLVDVKTGQPKDADLYRAQLGLDILKSLERIIEEVSLSVDKQIPDTGEEYYLVEDPFDQSLVEVERVLGLNYLKDNNQKNSLSLGVGGNVVLYGYEESGNPDGGFIGSFFSAAAILERELTESLSTRFRYRHSLDASVNQSLCLDLVIPLSELKRSESYMGLGGEWLTIRPDSAPEGELWAGNLILGKKRYWGERISERKWYTRTELVLPIYYSTNQDLREIFSIMVYAGRDF